MTSPVQQSFTSLAYHTSEAVPNTLYYRNEENEGQSRPSLETLRLGQAPPPVLISGVEVVSYNNVISIINCMTLFSKLHKNMLNVNVHCKLHAQSNIYTCIHVHVYRELPAQKHCAIEVHDVINTKLY